MAREFARAFYNSTAWKSCRDAYRQSVNGLCERCLASGRYVPGDEVHHKVYLTPQNINDPSVSLNWDNLILLCTSCHSKEHNAKHSLLGEGLEFDENGDLIYIPPSKKKAAGRECHAPTSKNLGNIAREGCSIRR